MPLQNPSGRYQVEISGWDPQGQFFVEHTVLVWDESIGKSISLKTPPKPGAVVFLRLLNPEAARNTTPVAYLAAQVERSERAGYEVTLSPVQPRHGQESAPESAVAGRGGQ